MTRREWCVGIFRKRLVQREDCFARQNGDGSYALVKSPLTDRVILSHLRGEETIALLPNSNGTTQWVCVDVDIRRSAAVESVREKLYQLSIPFLTEFSGRKGFHVWVFFDCAYPNASARALGKIICGGHEVFPKQEKISKGCFGSFIKAPLGKHRVTGEWCLFMDEDLSQIETPYEALEAVPTVDLFDLLERCHQPLATEETEKPPFSSALSDSTHVGFPKPFLLKDCVSQSLLTGTVQGHRNITAHILATELRRVGLPEESTLHLLSESWNPKNRPPLDASEIGSVVRSVYGKSLFEYGCRPDGSLRQTIQCLGEKKCAYYTTLKRMNRIGGPRP